MKKVQTFDTLLSLKPGDKFHKFHNGEHYGLIFVGHHPYSQRCIVAIKDSDFGQAEVIWEKDLMHRNKEFSIGYETEQAGKIMLAQVMDKAESIKKVYLKENEHDKATS